MQEESLKGELAAHDAMIKMLGEDASECQENSPAELEACKQREQELLQKVRPPLTKGI